MSQREFVALGTASQTPTRERSHNSYFLRWDEEGFLFDPGEGTQRQLIHAEVSACGVHRVCLTHFHGDHCLGLPGLLQRMSLNRCPHPVDVYYPEEGQPYFERLRFASVYYSQLNVIPHAVRAAEAGLVELWRGDKYVLYAHALEHSIPTIGYRIEELERRHFVPSKLESAGISGPAVGALLRHGSVCVNGRKITLEETTVMRPGSVVAFVMDTRPCPGATALARDADLLVMEATYASQESALAAAYGHATARDAAETARTAGARRLALTHFSARYPDTSLHVAEARAVFPETIALQDLDRVVIPRRRSAALWEP